MPVFSMRTEAHINVPAKAVWDKLTDTSTWPSWNSFVAEAEPVDTAQNERVGPQPWKLGERRLFHVNFGGSKQTSMEKVTVLEPAEGDGKIWKACWTDQGFPDFLLKTIRWNEIEETGPDQCVYRTGEDMFGPLAYVVKATFGKGVEKGIKDWAEDLKKAVEKETTKDTEQVS